MDTTPEYIKMCEKAEEIQKMWEPIGGDWYLADYHGATGFSKEQEQQIWGDKPETWERIQILSYKPSGTKDLYISTVGENSTIVSVKDLFKRRTVWLPRQDQLQEIWREGEAGLAVGEVKLLIEWMYQNKSYVFDFDTHEQLWLAFVMKEKFNKVWNREEWIKEV